jgi:hypothetical protein
MARLGPVPFGKGAGGVGQGGLQDDDVGPVAVHLKAGGQLGDGVQVLRLVGDRRQQ